MQLMRDARRDRVVDSNERDRFAAFLASAEAEGRNVDPVLTEPGSKCSDESRRVGVDDVDHLAGELSLDGNAEDVDEARRAIAEQVALYALGTMIRTDRHRH